MAEKQKDFDLKLLLAWVGIIILGISAMGAIAYAGTMLVKAIISIL